MQTARNSPSWPKYFIYQLYHQQLHHWCDLSASWSGCISLHWSDMAIILLSFPKLTSRSISFTAPLLILILFTSSFQPLYKSLIWPKLLYCSQVWHPHRVKDIKNFECVQHRTTKLILQDYQSDYKLASPNHSQSSSSITMVWIPGLLISSQMLTTPWSLQHF